VKRSIDLDDQLAAEVDQAASLIREKPATIMCLAIRAGFPTVTNRFQTPRPEGYFAEAYKDGARAKLEDAAGKAVIQKLER
jgi:predicted transcriptional regulator